MKNIRIFYLKIFIFWVVKFSIYLNRHVFVMWNAYKIVEETRRAHSHLGDMHIATTVIFVRIDDKITKSA